ncbi:hypothetical protein ACFPM7_26190 [Actinokineospora guangxiensis]|uniref:Uncharacterized protein n=1 Tax=Actinokineospora guangxiensis TaxID=1490288 RepID=A0ABW0ETQ5_9PSEU
MLDDDVLRCSVDDLVAALRQALVALVPVADRLLMGWRVEGEEHVDWELLSSAVFDACVGGPVRAEIGRVDDELPLARYDIDQMDFARFSWIRVEAPDHGDCLVMIRLVTGSEPFDSVRVVSLDPVSGAARGRLVLPYERCRFAFVRRTRGGRETVVRDVTAVE